MRSKMHSKISRIFLVFIVLSGCTNNSQPDAKPELKNENLPSAQSSKQAEWITFQSPDAPYTVRLPSQPVKRSQMTADGMLNKYICALGSNLALMTCANDFGGIDLSKPEQYDMIFDAATNAAIGESHGTVTEQETVLLEDKFPMRAFTASYNTLRKRGLAQCV